MKGSLGRMNQQQRVFTPRAIVQMLFFIVVVPFLPLLISWQWGWWEGWVYGLVGVLGFIISRALASRRHPDLLRERARFLRHEDAKRWDRTLASLVGLGGGLIPLVAGLDARFEWSPEFSLPLKILALVVLVGGFGLGSYALIENRFFSGMVRIQTERGHRVVSTGPYGWMRHPGYAGALWAYFATPLFLDAYWAFLPALFLAIVLVIRTRLEDQTLQEELDGYREYAKKVRYRLLPGIW
jgi:protein-S-isoprenylcysteine O-methyltransferase Ste14